MAKKTFDTANYGQLNVKDIMIDIDGTNLEGGIRIYDQNNKTYAEVVGMSTDDLEDGNCEDIETIVETYSNHEY